MSYHEKNTWAFGVVAPLGYLIYLAVTFVTGDGPLDGQNYVWPMIGTIAGAIVVGILTGIVLGIYAGVRGDKMASIADQRDTEINWFGERIGGSMIAIGGIVALVLCFVEAPHAYIANVLFLGFVLSAVLQAAAKLAAYRKGF
jgi:hypothetical protein